MTETEWKPSACILCECNCGVEIRLGADGHTFERVRGDKAHPASQGYTCEKALRLDYYQNGRGERVLHPLRRRPDGTFEEIDWDTAIREVAARLGHVRDTYGGETIVYYGGGGQGNHLGGTYSSATLNAFGARFRSSAIAQEKTGEAWVNGLMLGTPVRGEFEHCEVAVFVGKNPWMSHGIPHARTTLKAIANDPERSMVVIDPRRTETAELADFHLQVRPGRDAWLLAALAAVLVDESLLDRGFLAARTSGLEAVTAALRDVPIADYCRIAGVDEDLVRAAARRIARASSVAVFEDLGVQMNRYSTLVSYLEKLVWLLTGNLGRPGAQYSPTSLASLVRTSRRELDPETAPRSPVVGARIISGLIPCNVIPDEILTDHPQRYRAMIVESGQPGPLDRRQPAHAAGDRAARRRRVHRRVHDRDGPPRRLRAAGADAVREARGDVLQLRVPAQRVPPAPPGRGAAGGAAARAGDPRPARRGRRTAHGRGPGPAARRGRRGPGRVRCCVRRGDERPAPARRDRPRRAVPDAGTDAARRRGQRRRPVGARPALRPDEPERGAPGRASATDRTPATACSTPSSPARRASCSPTTSGTRRGGASRRPTGSCTWRSPSCSASWRRWPRTCRPGTIRSGRSCCRRGSGARSRRTRSCVTRRGASEMPRARCASSPADAAGLGLVAGDPAHLTTKRGRALVTVALDEAMHPGHLAIPNGLGLDHVDEDGRVRTGVAPNELTASEDRDPWVGTPWHKSVPARLEPVP